MEPGLLDEQEMEVYLSWIPQFQIEAAKVDAAFLGRAVAEAIGKMFGG
jgi:hypothetical protein